MTGRLLLPHTRPNLSQSVSGKLTNNNLTRKRRSPTKRSGQTQSFHRFQDKHSEKGNKLNKNCPKATFNVSLTGLPGTRPSAHLKTWFPTFAPTHQKSTLAKTKAEMKTCARPGTETRKTMRIFSSCQRPTSPDQGYSPCHPVTYDGHYLVLLGRLGGHRQPAPEGPTALESLGSRACCRHPN